MIAFGVAAQQVELVFRPHQLPGRLLDRPLDPFGVHPFQQFGGALLAVEAAEQGADVVGGQPEAQPLPLPPAQCLQDVFPVHDSPDLWVRKKTGARTVSPSGLPFPGPPTP
jgi:hypothetical protein